MISIRNAMRLCSIRTLFVIVAMLLAGTSTAVATPPPSEQTIADAYVYLLGRALVVRQEQIDRKGDGFTFNTIKYNPLGSADFVNPNFDVAYLEAWVGVDDKTPALLEVPKIEGRYYTAEILDEWGEVIANINERTFPSMPYGTFAIVAPGSTASIPEGAGRIELHSNKAKLLGRVELKGDPDGALALQKQFKLTSTGTPEISTPPDQPMFDNDKLLGVEIFDTAEAVIASALDVSPVAASVQEKVRAVAAYVKSSDEARKAVDALLRDKVVPGFKEYALTKASPYRDHWMIGNSAGNYDKDYWARSSANYAGIWANNSGEVIYLVATRDSDEKPLDGSRSYVMHFPADSLPQSVVDSYWSVILVGVPDYRVVPNDLKRYNFNTYSALKSEADGSLKIGIGPKPPAGIAESNWLPSAAGKPFSLTYRAYVPKDVVKQGKWTPPPLIPVP